jgi:hypothetical protein
MIKRIEIQVIPHNEQRYETCGDWVVEGDKLTVFASDLAPSSNGDDLVAEYGPLLVGLHEAIEAILCCRRGIKQEDVDAFDKDFEKARAETGSVAKFHFRGRTLAIDEEPGDQEDAPYFREHQFATNVEFLIAHELGVNPGRYEEAVNELSRG